MLLAVEERRIIAKSQKPWISISLRANLGIICTLEMDSYDVVLFPCFVQSKSCSRGIVFLGHLEEVGSLELVFPASHDQTTALISNCSTSYNVVSISIILPILSTSSLYNSSLTDTTSSIVASSLIAGMIIGQLIGGAMGDLIGRKQGMMLVMFLQVIGSVGSAFSYDGFGGWSVFEQLAIWRFLVGIGCGGVYPLAALLSSEAMMIPLTSQSSGQQQ
jgi:hypothetical protein